MTLITNQKHPLNCRSVRREKGLTLEEVAREAGFASTTSIYLFEIGAIVDTDTKEQILGALSRLTGQPYTLSDVEFGSALEVHVPTAIPSTAGILEGKSK